jgi:hypothetical protein
MTLVAVTSATTAPPIIQWHHLFLILVYSLVSGLVVVALVSGGVRGLALARRDGAAPSLKRWGWATTTLMGAASVAVVGWGLYLISHKG